MIRCRYSVVRFTPDPSRGECVNVGVILHATEKGELACRFSDNFRRVRALDPRADLDYFRDLALEWRTAVGSRQLWKPGDENSPKASIFGSKNLADNDFLEHLSRDFDGVVTYTSPRATTAYDIQKEVNELFLEFVSGEDAEEAGVSSASMAPSKVRERVVRNFRRRGLVKPGKLEEGILVPGTHDHRWAFDLGLRNGRYQVIQSIPVGAHLEANLNRILLLTGRVTDARAALGNDQSIDANAVLVAASDDMGAQIADAKARFRDRDVHAYEFKKEDEIKELRDRIELALGH